MNDFAKFQRILRGEKLPGCDLPIIESPDAPKPCIEYKIPRSNVGFMRASNGDIIEFDKTLPVFDSPAPKSKRGGKRKGAGRKQLSPDCATVYIDISLPADLHNKARRIGNGNISEGIRIALDYFPI